MDLQERIERLIPKGDRSKVVCNLLEDYCNKLELAHRSVKVKKQWFNKTIAPFIMKYANGGDLYSLIESKKLQIAFTEAGIEISAADIKLCIEEILFRGEE